MTWTDTTGVIVGAIHAVGYVRRDVSGIRQQWDETQLRSLAKRLGYNLRKTVAVSSALDTGRLVEMVAAAGAAAVFVPNAEHFGGSLPAELVAVADVITVCPEATYARWSTGMLPDELYGNGR